MSTLLFRLSELVARDLVRRPPVLDGEAQDPTEIAALVFGIRPNKEHPDAD